jgi:hypothetical protein
MRRPSHRLVVRPAVVIEIAVMLCVLLAPHACAAYEALAVSSLFCSTSSSPFVSCDGYVRNGSASPVAGSTASALLSLCLAPLPPYHTEGYCGACAAASAGGLGYRCAAAAYVPSPLGNATRLCAVYGLPISCALGTVVTSVCGSAVAPCDDAAFCFAGGEARTAFGTRADFGMRCTPVLSTTISLDSCEWRFAVFDGNLGCEAGEVMIGLCVGRSPGDCFGSPFAAAARCCVNRTVTACAPAPSWSYVSNVSAICRNNTAVSGFCAVRCDPYQIYDFRFNTGMFSCTGWTPTESYGQFVSPTCKPRQECPLGYVVTAVQQCYGDDGPGTILRCAKASFAAVSTSDCLELRGDEFIWCPRGYVATAACGPNRAHACPSGFDGELRCCQVSSFHSLGAPCPSNHGYALVAAKPSNVPLGHGVGDGFPAIMASTGVPTGVAGCGDNVFVSTSEHVLLRLFRSKNVVNATLGSIGSPGMDDSIWRPYLWNSSTTKLRNPTAISIRGTPSLCAAAVLVDSGNFIVRGIDAGLLNGNRAMAMLVDIVAGVPGTPPAGAFVNGSSIYTAKFPDGIFGVYSRASDDSTFITTKAGVLRCDTDELDAAVVSYYTGTGVPGNAVPGVFRTQSQLSAPGAIDVLEDAMLYIGDRTMNVYGGVVTVSLATGIVDVLPDTALPSTVEPTGLALYVSGSGQQFLFVASAPVHAIFRVDLALRSYVMFAGLGGTSGTADRASLSNLRFSSPSRVAVADNILYIIDTGNSRLVQVPLMPVCATGQDPTRNCEACQLGYFGYPRCRKACANSSDCSSRALVITGHPGTASCRCTCMGRYSGATCATCATGFDPRTDCTRCLPNYHGPECNTYSDTLTASHEETESQPPMSESASPSDEDTMTASAIRTRTPTPSYSNITESRSVAPTRTPTPTATPSVPKSRTPKPTASESETFSLPQNTDSLTLTTSDEHTASMTNSLVPSPSDTSTFSGSGTASSSPPESISSSATLTASGSLSSSQPVTTSASESWALIAPRLFHAGDDFLVTATLGTGPAKLRSVLVGIWAGKYDSFTARQVNRGYQPPAICFEVVGVNGIDFDLSVESVRVDEPALDRAVVVVLGRDDNSKDGGFTLKLNQACVAGRHAPPDGLVFRLERQPDPPLINDDAFQPTSGALIGSAAALAAVSANAAVAASSLAAASLAPTFYAVRCHWDTDRKLDGLPFVLAPFRDVPLGASRPATNAIIGNCIVIVAALLVPCIAAHYTAESSERKATAVLAQWRLPGRVLLFPVLPFAFSTVFLVVRGAARPDIIESNVSLHFVVGSATVLLVVGALIVPLIPSVDASGQPSAEIEFRRFTILEMPLATCPRLWTPAGAWLASGPSQSTPPRSSRTPSRSPAARSPLRRLPAPPAVWPVDAVRPLWAPFRLYMAPALVEIGCGCALVGLLAINATLGCVGLAIAVCVVHVLRLAWWVVVRPAAAAGVNMTLSVGAGCHVISSVLGIVYVSNGDQVASVAAQGVLLGSVAALLMAPLCSCGFARRPGKAVGLRVPLHDPLLLSIPALNRYQHATPDDSSISPTESGRSSADEFVEGRAADDEFFHTPDPFSNPLDLFRTNADRQPPKMRQARRVKRRPAGAVEGVAVPQVSVWSRIIGSDDGSGRDGSSVNYERCSGSHLL